MPITVLANGVFDLLHYGHVQHLEAAKKLGDILWVSITDDRHVNKGPGRPIYPQEHRAAMVKALKCVDKVITVSSLIEAIDFVKPEIVVKGIDYREGLHDVHAKYCRDRGIEIRFTDTPKLSATEMIWKMNGERCLKNESGEGCTYHKGGCNCQREASQLFILR